MAARHLAGPAAWLQRVPHPPDGASGRPPDMPPSPFAFFQPLDYAAALALNLLVCPPALRGERFCIHCASGLLDVVPSMARMVGTLYSVRMASVSVPPSMILPGTP